MKPGEITEESLRLRLRAALTACGLELGRGDARDLEPYIERAYVAGTFSELVGVVDRATAAERQRAANTARRLGHTQTAQVIREGK